MNQKAQSGRQGDRPLQLIQKPFWGEVRTHCQETGSAWIVPTPPVGSRTGGKD